MRAKRNRWVWGCLLALCPLAGLQAQFYTGDDEGSARWGLEYTGGVMVKPLLQENPQQVSTGRGSWHAVRGEYFFPKKWGERRAGGLRPPWPPQYGGSWRRRVVRTRQKQTHAPPPPQPPRRPPRTPRPCPRPRPRPTPRRPPSHPPNRNATRRRPPRTPPPHANPRAAKIGPSPI